LESPVLIMMIGGAEGINLVLIQGSLRSRERRCGGGPKYRVMDSEHLRVLKGNRRKEK
jgi:hypothetical protein